MDAPEHAALLRVIGRADEASTTMVPYGPMNDKWMQAFIAGLEQEGLAISSVAPLRRLGHCQIQAKDDAMYDDESSNWIVPEESWIMLHHAIDGVLEEA